MSNKQLAPNTPILVGIGTSLQRSSEPAKSLEACALMSLAAANAAKDCGVVSILQQCDSIAVPRGTWSYTDPARLIANELGIGNAKTILADIGILQQTLVSNACAAIQRGEQSIALICGGEAKYRAIQISKQGLQIPETSQVDTQADEFLTISGDIVSDAEMQRGMAMPVTPYAIMESAMRYKAGLGIEQHRRELGGLYAKFADIAARNPDAWIKDGFSAEEIAQASEQNRMLAFPYTKRMNTQWNVDQASALLLCSVAKAEELGIAPEQWLFPVSSTESDHMTLVSERAELHRCEGAKIAGQRVLELANTSIDMIDYLELYSCFPAAVKAYAQELDVKPGKPLVVTGSMAFAGGPLNNFVLQSTATMGRLLRQNPGKTGLVSSVSGMLTKQAFAVWSSTPQPQGFQFDDVSEQTAAAAKCYPLDPDYAGPARVSGYTVNSIPGFPDSLIAVCDTPNKGRAIATSSNTELIEHVCAQEFCGERVTIGTDNELSYLPI
ncbi:MAG: hypothetical protein AB8B86_02940 [Pseudomonadales bacterium]